MVENFKSSKDIALCSSIVFVLAIDFNLFFYVKKQGTCEQIEVNPTSSTEEEEGEAGYQRNFQSHK